MNLKQETKQILQGIENPDGSGYVVIFRDIPWYNKETEKMQMRCYIEKNIDNLSKPVSIAREEHFEQYPRQYEAYLQAKKQKDDGTSLQLLPRVTPADIENCESARIYSIEKLSEASDDDMIQIGDKSLRKRAVAFLKGESEKDLEIAELKKQLEEAKHDSSNDGAGHSGRDTTVREAGKRSGERKQGNETGLKLPKDGS